MKRRKMKGIDVRNKSKHVKTLILEVQEAKISDRLAN